MWAIRNADNIQLPVSSFICDKRYSKHRRDESDYFLICKHNRIFTIMYVGVGHIPKHIGKYNCLPILDVKMSIVAADTAV